MALIGAYDDDGNRHRNSAPSWQRYLEHLESTVRGEPGRPRVNPEPFQVREESELVDGPVVAPPPPRSKRKGKAPLKADMPAPDRDAVNLKAYARRLKGEP
jgi:hypothetical protein